MLVEQDGFTYELRGDGTAAVKGYKGGEKAPLIPWEVDGRPVAAISDWAFGRLLGSHPLTHIVIPETVTAIGAYAFHNCGRLTRVFLPDTLTDLGASAFSGCVALECAALPVGVTALADRVFDGCRNLTRVDLHEGITAIGKGAFNGCRVLAHVTLPPGVTRIAYETFRDCRSLDEIIIHENIDHIGHYAFSGAGLKGVTLPDAVAYIGHKEAFPPGTVIRASYNSYADRYAKKYDYPFVPIFPGCMGEQSAQRTTSPGSMGEQAVRAADEPPSDRALMLETLQKIRAAQGEAALKSPRVFRGLLSDFLPGGKHAGLRNILNAAADELRIFDAFALADASGDFLTASRMTAALVNLGYRESLARDAVECLREMKNGG